MSFAKTRGRHCTWNLRVACGVAAKACADAAALRAKRPAADDGERERRRQMRGTAEEAAAAAVIAPPSSETSTSRKKRALIVRGASQTRCSHGSTRRGPGAGGLLLPGPPS